MLSSEAIMELSSHSQRSLMRLCGIPLRDSEIATSFVSRARHDSGFYSSTLPRPGSDVQAVIGQAEQIAASIERPHFAWAPAGSCLALAFQRRGWMRSYSLSVMAYDRNEMRREVGDSELVCVTDHDSAELFRSVHLAQFSNSLAPEQVVAHFASDRILLDSSVRAMVLVSASGPVSAGFLHLTSDVSGIYWLATVASQRNQGYACRVMSALMNAAPATMPVVLQATELGIPVYRRRGFREYGRVECWHVIAPPAAIPLSI